MITHPCRVRAKSQCLERSAKEERLSLSSASVGKQREAPQPSIKPQQ